MQKQLFFTCFFRLQIQRMAFVVLLVFSFGAAFSQNIAPALQPNETIVSLLDFRGQPCLVTSTHLFFWKKKAWLLAADLPEKMTTAAVAADRLWLGGKTGLFYFDKEKKALIMAQKAVSVAALAEHEADENLLVASKNKAFLLKDTAFSQNLMERTEAQAICSCGGFSWVGTPVGLFRVDKNGQIQKYGEEGIMGFEIPDNIVEGLFCSKKQVLTVVMSEALAFLPIEKGIAPAHGTHFEYLGEQGNAIFGQLEMPSGNFLFLTEKGLFELPTSFLQHAHEEVASIEVHNDSANPKAIPIFISEKSTWKTGFFDKKKALWLASETMVVRVKI